MRHYKEWHSWQPSPCLYLGEFIVDELCPLTKPDSPDSNLCSQKEVWSSDAPSQSPWSVCAFGWSLTSVFSWSQCLSGRGFPASSTQGKVTCCSSTTRTSAGLSAIVGGTRYTKQAYRYTCMWLFGAYIDSVNDGFITDRSALDVEWIHSLRKECSPVPKRWLTFFKGCVHIWVHALSFSRKRNLKWLLHMRCDRLLSHIERINKGNCGTIKK